MSVLWASTVENYSSRIFSLWEDRLPALAGVAANFRSPWGNTNYFAGLWGFCLIIHLCWRRHEALYSREKKVPLALKSRYSWIMMDKTRYTKRTTFYWCCWQGAKVMLEGLYSSLTSKASGRGLGLSTSGGDR
jgi:hypothetical protein